LDADSWILSGLLALGALLAAFSAAAELALASANRSRVRQVAAHKSQVQTVEALLSEPERFLSTLLVLKLVGFVMVAGVTTILAQRLGDIQSVIWGLVAATLVLIASQLFPRALVLGRQERVALWLAPSVQILTFLLTPLTALMRQIGQDAALDNSTPESILLSEDGLRFLLNMSAEESAIEDEEREMIASIFEFGETLVREVMVPRIDIVAVPVDMSMLEALDVILKAGHSRIPVYSNSVDNVVGVLYAKDLLRYLRDGRTDVPLSKILRKAYFIPESKKVDDLLGEMQQRRVHLSIVVDEYGGTAGLVTIEDLLEEIVGEIQDEYDAEEPTVERVSEHEYLFDARVDLDEVNKLLKVALPAEGGDTLGGFIYSQLGKVPAVGDTIEFENVVIEVLSVAGRRIMQVRARVIPPGDNAPPVREVKGNNAGPAFLAFFSVR